MLGVGMQLSSAWLWKHRGKDRGRIKVDGKRWQGFSGGVEGGGAGAGSKAGGGAEAEPEGGRHFAVAGQAKGAEIVEVALAAAFGYGKDVVGVPQGATGANRAQAPKAEQPGAGFAAGALQLAEGKEGVGGAKGADAPVAGQDLVAKVAWVGAETPLMHAELRAEGAAAGGEDLELTPAAERPAIGTEREGRNVGAAGILKRTGRQHA